MLSKRICAALAAACLLLPLSVGAAQVGCGETYCFGTGDFSREELSGICLTGLPDERTGTLLLGDRVLRPGDILTADQIAQMTFCPALTERDDAATVTYLPIFPDHVAPARTMTISIRGRENEPPVAEDFAAETYKNLPLEGKLKVKDPENEAMTFTLVRGPKRGQVELREDGSFTYTPKKNKVGIDSFVFTATDASGKVSRETTVTVTIVKPTDATQYTDTVGRDCRFAAEWMKNTGIFVAEKVDGNTCFSPDKTVSRGEFLTMLVRTLEIPTEEAKVLQGYEDVPAWLQPYLAAAVRSGLVTGLPLETGFDCDSPITGAEAAVMIHNALDLSGAAETAGAEAVPVWAAQALEALRGYDIRLEDTPMTRAQAAQVLYLTSRLAPDAPGMVVIRGSR